jgi:hypothetical protein
MQREEAIDLLPSAIRRVQAEIRWRRDSADHHLYKRRLRRHLPLEATIEDYHGIIRTILTNDKASVYLCWYDEGIFPAVTAKLAGRLWLVMFSLDGFMKSAFIIENPGSYLNKPNFEYIGLLSEVMK